MKLSVLLALTSTVAAGAATEGCFAKVEDKDAGDAKKLANCTCDKTCKLCGYDADAAKAAKLCVTCSDAKHVMTPSAKDAKSGTCAAAKAKDGKDGAKTKAKAGKGEKCN